MRSTLHLADRVLEWAVSPGEAPERRPIGADGEALLRGWAETYRRALIRPDPWADIIELGRQMYRWLDDGSAWLGRARERGVTPPWVVNFIVPVAPQPLEMAFLEAPWEVLSDAAGLLAADRSLVFCPVRRLGRPATEEPPSPQRLSAVFMTALPEGNGDLAFEAEEAAVLDAAAGAGMDLVVEDSGHLPWLGELLGRLGRVDILHLSCHGSAEPRPLLLLEDELGRPAAATADDLDAALQPRRPRALFLSACETAAADKVLGSLAATLVQRGVPAVLGWGGSVLDEEAGRFAAELYQRLSRHGRLDEAVAWARLALLGADNLGRRSRDWHQARLFAGAAGGGVLTAGGHKRALRDRRQVNEKAFLDARGQVQVAGPEEFIGRRRDLQRILRAFRTGATGVVVHGIGRQGKSSLALRVVQRLPDHRPLVLYGPFDGSALLDALADVVAEPAARELVRQNRELLRDEGTLVDVLVQMLETYCAQPEGSRRPILFVLDDFEQLLEPADAPPKRPVARFIEPVRALVRALDRAETESKLLITSRYTFTLPWQQRDLTEGFLWHSLPAMSDTDRRKQLRTKLRLLAAGVADPEQLPRLLAVAQGNPGLQDLLTLLLIEAPQQAARALSEMEARLSGQGEVDDERLVAFLANLALGTLLALLLPQDRELLRVSTLFSIPIPQAVMAALAANLSLVKPGGPVGDRLVGLGLWEVHAPDTSASLLVSGLARLHAGTLSTDEESDLAGDVVAPLFEAWGGAGAGRWKRSWLQDLELTRLALLCGAAQVVAACAEDAVAAEERSLRNREAAALGLEAITLLDDAGVATPLGLLHRAAVLCQLTGDTLTARRLYGRAREAILAKLRAGEELDSKDHAAVLISQSRLLVEDGRIQDALEGFEQARELLKRTGRAREVAVTLGDIAQIKVSRGEVEAALALHDERLRVFEALGDARERAVTLGDIARIKLNRGEVEVALALHDERLRVFEALGDALSRAVTLGDIARIKVNRGEVEAALSLHEENLRVFEALGAARARAMTLGDIAGIKESRGEVEAALSLHEEMLRIFEALGDARSRAAALGGIARIKESRGEVEAALSLHEEMLRVFEALGDARSRAVALGDIAGIRESRGEVEVALSLHEERLRVFEALGDARERAVTLGGIARIREFRGEAAAALLLHDERLRVFEALGDARLRAVTLGDIARIKVSRGEVEEALSLHEERLRVFEALADARSRAVTLGGIARIKESRGEMEAALSLHEEMVRVFEALGNAQLRAVTLGDIARIKESRGEVEEALSLHEERLRVFEALGDVREKAHTLWNLATIDLEQGREAVAVGRLAEAYEITLRLGRLDGICFVGLDLGRLLCALGSVAEGQALLERSLAGFRQLGQDAMAQSTEKLLATLPPLQPPSEQATNSQDGS